MASRDVPDLVSLDLLCCVVSLGSLSRAAAERGMSQPSATARLRRLEHDLGVTLLERSPTGSRPTVEGARIASLAEPIIEGARQLVSSARAMRPHEVAGLRIAASFTIAEYLMADWFGRMPPAFPAAIGLDVVNSTDVLIRVRDERATVGFIESPGDVGGLMSQDVGGDELVCVVGDRHPWARRRGPLPAATLAATPLILRERGSGTRDALTAALRRAGLGDPRSAMELGSTEAVKAAVAAGSGPAVVSRLAVAANPKLVIVTVSGLDLSRRFRAVWLPNRAVDRRVRALLDIAGTPDRR